MVNAPFLAEVSELSALELWAIVCSDPVGHSQHHKPFHETLVRIQYVHALRVYSLRSHKNKEASVGLQHMYGIRGVSRPT